MIGYLRKNIAGRLAGILALSSFVILLAMRPVAAHELRPAIADLTVTQTDVTLTLDLPLEPLIIGMNLSQIADTNDSPLSDQHDALRKLSPPELEAALRKVWPAIASQILLKAGGTPLTPQITALTIPDVGNPDLPRDSILTLHADLPEGDSPVTLTWGAGLGLLALRQSGDETAYEALLSGGETSLAIPRSGQVQERAGSFFIRYIILGFEHIVPKGLDHILFVLGLFFFALHLRPLLWQVTTFTLAHTLTLALASLGIIQIPASIVEPLIAASITYVAIENIMGSKLGLRRILIVMVFGLLHGLGFASVLGELGLQPGSFLISLIGFNIGVELGQLAVITAAFLAVGLWFGRKPWYRQGIAIPASAAIGLVGAWWFVERVFL